MTDLDIHSGYSGSGIVWIADENHTPDEARAIARKILAVADDADPTPEPQLLRVKTRDLRHGDKITWEPGLEVTVHSVRHWQVAPEGMTVVLDLGHERHEGHALGDKVWTVTRG